MSQAAAIYGETSVRFRRIGPGDRDTASALCAAYRRADAQPEASEQVRASIDAALQGDPAIHIYLVELLEESEARDQRAAMVVGYVAVTLGFSVEVGGRDAFIDELYIVESAQGRGLGRRALDFAEQLARQLGARRVRLEVEHHNTRAKKLYDALGYRDHSRFLLFKSLV